MFVAPGLRRQHAPRTRNVPEIGGFTCRKFLAPRRRTRQRIAGMTPRKGMLFWSSPFAPCLCKNCGVRARTVDDRFTYDSVNRSDQIWTFRGRHTLDLHTLHVLDIVLRVGPARYRFWRTCFPGRTCTIRLLYNMP